MAVVVNKAGSNAAPWSPADLDLMRAALSCARSASGRVAPNPAVGAVVARDGHILATGATQPPPGPHAEVVALHRAGEAARGAALYVTLEPCSHFGRTPPCTDALITAGVRRVVIGTLDRNPAVHGQGVRRLRDAGIEVETGCLEDEACEQIAGFATRMRLGRPRTIAKYAMTLDGRIATATGHSRWISGPESRQHVHVLRDRVDAILVGSGTLLADDPQLTTRLPDDLCGYGGPHHPLRVVLDSQLRTPPASRMLSAETPGETLIYCIESAPETVEAAIADTGATVIRVPSAGGRVDLSAVLADLGERGINDLLIEGGGTVLGSFFDAGLIDHALVFVAPVIVGGRDAPSPVGGEGVPVMPDAWRLVNRRVSQLGDDLLIEGDVVRGQEGDGV